MAFTVDSLIQRIPTYEIVIQLFWSENRVCQIEFCEPVFLGLNFKPIS